MDFNSIIMLFKEKRNRLAWKRVGSTNVPTLALKVDRALLDWQQALREFNYADRDMVDCAILKIKLKENYYMALLRQAKKEQVIAWSADLFPYNQKITMEDGKNVN